MMDEPPPPPPPMQSELAGVEDEYFERIIEVCTLRLTLYRAAGTSLSLLLHETILLIYVVDGE